MIKVGKPEKGINYLDRKSSYGIVTNELGQIAVVHHKSWGLVFPGGKVEPNEDPSETIKRESLEEIGYEIDNLKYYDTVETWYEVASSKPEDQKLLEQEKVYCHNIADIYIGNIKDKVQEQIEPNAYIEWYYPNELLDNMKMEFQNTILRKVLEEQLI